MNSFRKLAVAVIAMGSVSVAQADLITIKSFNLNMQVGATGTSEGVTKTNSAQVTSTSATQPLEVRSIIRFDDDGAGSYVKLYVIEADPGAPYYWSFELEAYGPFNGDELNSEDVSVFAMAQASMVFKVSGDDSEFGGLIHDLTGGAFARIKLRDLTTGLDVLDFDTSSGPFWDNSEELLLRDGHTYKAEIYVFNDTKDDEETIVDWLFRNAEVKVLEPDTIQRCDTNYDGTVDIYDIRMISLNRNQLASGPDDPMDWDQDGVIDILDARGCQRVCTFPRCAAP